LVDLVLVQKSVFNGSLGEKLSCLRGLAKGHPGSLVVLPEMWFSGYPPAEGWGEEEYREVVGCLTELSVKEGCGFVVNLPYFSAGGLLNRSLFVAKGRVVGLKDKEVLFKPMNEDKVFSPPSEPLRPVFAYEGFKFGLAVCYELRFPEIFREYALLGVEGVVVNAGWGKSRVYAWKNFLQARASENQFFLIGVNSVGGDYGAGGNSSVVGPDGKFWLELGEEEAVVSFRVDPSRVYEEREKFPLFSDFLEMKGRWERSGG